MYIKPKLSGNLLVHKMGWKTISTKIWKEGISKEVLANLTKKECSLIFETEEYGTFKGLLHNHTLLQSLIIQSKLLLNIISIITLIEKTNPLYSQGLALQWRLENNFPIEFIYHSNNIEGSKIPKNEVAKMIQGKKLMYKIKNEIKEVENSIKSRKFLQKKFLWNIAHIKKLYHLLTKNLLQENGNFYPRGFKKIPIVVNNETTVQPDQVEQEIWKLITTVKQKKMILFPLQLAFDFHLRYEQIHPFENGNGRTGRLLMNKILLQHGMLPMVVFKENKTAYFSAIKKAAESQHGKKVYYTFMIEQYKKSLELRHTLPDLKGIV